MEPRKHSLSVNYYGTAWATPPAQFFHSLLSSSSVLCNLQHLTCQNIYFYIHSLYILWTSSKLIFLSIFCLLGKLVVLHYSNFSKIIFIILPCWLFKIKNSVEMMIGTVENICDNIRRKCTHIEHVYLLFAFCFLRIF